MLSSLVFTSGCGVTGGSSFQVLHQVLHQVQALLGVSVLALILIWVGAMEVSTQAVLVLSSGFPGCLPLSAFTLYMLTFYLIFVTIYLLLDTCDTKCSSFYHLILATYHKLPIIS